MKMKKGRPMVPSTIKTSPRPSNAWEMAFPRPFKTPKLIIISILLFIAGCTADYYTPHIMTAEPSTPRDYYYDIDWDALIQAIIEVESGGDPNALGKDGEIGLMQISPCVVEEYHKYAPSGLLCGLDLFNPYDNKSLGTWYLHRLQDHYIPKDKFCLDVLLACWNWGPTKVAKADHNVGWFPNVVREYVKKVVKIYEKKVSKQKNI